MGWDQVARVGGEGGLLMSFYVVVMMYSIMQNREYDVQYFQKEWIK